MGEELLNLISLYVLMYVAWKAFTKWLDERIATVAAAGVTVAPGPAEAE